MKVHGNQCCNHPLWRPWPIFFDAYFKQKKNNFNSTLTYSLPNFAHPWWLPIPPTNINGAYVNFVYITYSTYIMYYVYVKVSNLLIYEITKTCR